MAFFFAGFILMIVYGGQILLEELPPSLGWTRAFQLVVILCIAGGTIGAVMRIYTTANEETTPEDTDTEDTDTEESEEE
jgi:low affinity Fe/Cu permease